MTEQTVGVIGGGIVGLAVARELSRRHESVRVLVFEKEDRLGAHQTGHNSGVVHAGIYYPPGGLKAELCKRGRSMLREYCSERSVPYVECGKLVIAVDESELGRFDALEVNARRNGVPGLRRVSGSGITEIEPHADGVAALHSPETAITDYAAVAAALGEDVGRAGGRVLLSTAVTGLRRRHDGIDVVTTGGVHRVDRLVVCAGLRSDRVSRWADGADGPRIVPFRGEYMRLAPSVRELVRGMIYPVPDPRYPFLGVHFTRRVSGEVEVGPNAVLGLAREGYRRRDVSPGQLRDMASWPGFWRMARAHWRTGVREVVGSLSVRAYMRSASRYVPAVGPADVRRAGSGIRAQAVDRDGSLVDDFRINHADGVTTVRNAPSPAATSGLAIAEHVVDRMESESP
ncbi:L-2-hydroxyglutarate oxidase LhgO [Actinopolyspora xinjiangensis]|uniref:L-2-hydroxyglutarate oxidase LhgO n=1 Tax=Actinopolyspora xinjiangensis TaxID=405564 RepID=A0A1H0TM32_9ACTN|nr:L-2-hydroxyglutarate oxidase [Actinopolyspora xinjiangensis]SDP55084.1 L-2-hydroxyglutarate oxidase LhgO [Actinopolyspora xinjiangensis]